MFIKYSEKDNRSDYLEFQICEMDRETDINEVISVTNITHWKEDSLYVCTSNLDDFINEYDEYLNEGIQSKIDIYGLNYFTIDKTIKILENISLNRPKNFQILIEFLNKAKLKNGFYVLGI